MLFVATQIAKIVPIDMAVGNQGVTIFCNKSTSKQPIQGVYFLERNGQVDPFGMDSIFLRGPY